MVVVRFRTSMRIKGRRRITELVPGQPEYRFIYDHDGDLASRHRAARGVAHLDRDSSLAARLKRLVARRGFDRELSRERRNLQVQRAGSKRGSLRQTRIDIAAVVGSRGCAHQVYLHVEVRSVELFDRNPERVRRAIHLESLGSEYP